MMSYKDRTWCMYKSCKDFDNGCDIALTDEVRKDAQDWWGSDMYPVSVFYSKPICYEEGK